MRKDHKEYIIENVRKKTSREIADTLGIGERKVKNFITENNLKQANKQPDSQKDKSIPLSVNKSWWIHIVLIIIIMLATFAAYSGALKNDFIWDDEFLIRDNPSIKSFSQLPLIFTSYLASASGNRNNFYRPLQELSYTIDYFLWGKGPFGFHLGNIIIHIFTAVLLYLLLLRILKSALPSFFAAILFGVHPINTEAVTYIAGRADSLYLFFLLASLILFLKAVMPIGSERKLNYFYYAASLISYILALLSKEIAIVFLLIIALYIFVFSETGHIRKKYYQLCIPFAAVTFLFILIRKSILLAANAAPSFVMEHVGIFFRLLTFFKTVFIYLSLLIIPTGLHMERRVRIAQSLLEPAALFSLITMVIVIAAIVMVRKKSKIVFFGAAWFCLGLLPVSNIVPLNSFIAEHWLYMPAIGIFIIFAAVLSRLLAIFSTQSYSLIKKTILILCVASILSGYAVMTRERNNDWKDEYAFFENTLKYSPDNARLHLNYGNTCYENKDYDKAIQHYERAVELRPNYPLAYTNMAVAYLSRGDRQKAKECLSKALLIDPRFDKALNLVAAIERS